MLDNHISAWLVFLGITVLRQVWYVAHLLHHPTQATSKAVQVDTIRTWLLYAIYIAIWLGSLFTSLRRPLVPALYVLGLLLVVIGIGLRWLGLRDLRTQFASHITIQPNYTLVISGIYTYIRHPLHLGMIVELLGMVVIGQAMWLGILWLVLVLIT